MIPLRKIKNLLKRELELLLRRTTTAKSCTEYLQKFIKNHLKEQRYHPMIQMHKETEIKLTSKEKHFIITLIKMEFNLIMQYLTI
jgi:hypothetical protein